jgi:hypothetical protein
MSAVVSVILTTAFMLIAHATHSPACATTLIVSLGLLPGVTDGMLIMTAVTGMFLVHRFVLMVRKSG